ncbi:imidazolonepropionase [Paenibacillus jilunlii]|uniref:Imidazolonepropionase n=1 Tax=Paenibacillus jilunlii TaxID=682956 RepID=A0A1G9SUL7_9BACL|nr:imidazolonepropionase [Paenibacillus jilunlii]KWX75115.1 imidazolonepropionase [Paenibacillus jilunlii]SDM38545.1 imidazolonepropionase [Paenibacillus jilunlii]
MIYIHSAAQIATLRGASAKPKAGKEMEELGLIEDGGIVIEDGIFTFVGSSEEARRYVAEHSGNQEVTVLSAEGRTVTPGLIDPHTHIVFSGSREFELNLRLQGAKYMDILNAGGGILYTTERTREAAEEQLMAETVKRLDRFLEYGVTTVEAKSGYGLRLEDELKQLRVVRRLNASHPVDLVPTFMGAHAVPVEYKGNADAFVRTVIEDMIPAVAREELAEFCDVFCEEGAFTVNQSRDILAAGQKWGLKPKIHADELVSYGGAELAAELGAVSADHLLHVSEAGIQRMAEAGVIAVLLPGTAFFLMAQPANARAMIAAGVPVALSTDRNPGSSPTESLPFIMNLACLTMRMTPAEVLAACTINAAHAIGRAATIGSIEVGKQADLVLFDAPNYLYLQYHYAVNLVDTVFKKGEVVIQNGRRVSA